MAAGFTAGARLMRASADVLRRDPGLLWFPAISTCCLLVTAGFWIFEGAWLYAIHASALLFVPVVVRLLIDGHVHSRPAQVFLGIVLLAGFGLGVAVGVVRQVFAVSLYRRAAATPESAALIA